MRITVEDKASPGLRAMMERLARRTPLHRAMGKGVEVELRAHFEKRDGEGNKQGWPSRHFWNRVVRKATSLAEADEAGAVVSVASKEFLHKVHGGTITAQNGKYLAIPLTARAYQVGSPRLWPNGSSALTLVKTARAAVLIEAYHSRLGRGNRGKIFGGQAHYLLVRSVRQKADPRALPSETKLQGRALMAARDYLEAMR